ncbi:HotDog domain-containing protein [Hypoxylon rubiginosum]|uniref:HotDog domain-containing protein n=1 Tax=Hypoxylon rubiginosum TaxID=110542 RepID=A0ACB9Z4C3_9PEZI|nr:HotDog domain-containing protein [Hypoxylon rubiginosum]
MLAGPRAGLLCRRAALGTRSVRRPPPVPIRANPTIRTRRGVVARSPAPSQLSSCSSARLFTTSRIRSADHHTSKPKEDPIAATATAAPVPPPEPQQPASSSPDQPPRRRRRGLYHGAVFLLVGISLGTLLRYALAPPPRHPPGSPGDVLLTSKIHEDGSALPLVRELSADPAWTSWDAYAGLPARMVSSRITSGPLSGAGGLPFQRLFHHGATGELVSVVYFGPGTTGWPGVVHGGALATVLDETLGRCAILRFPARTGVTARFELAYRAPTVASRFYVVRARPAAAENEGHDPAKSDRKMWVDGTLETLDGRVCVHAKALFVVPKGVKLQPLVEGF